MLFIIGMRLLQLQLEILRGRGIFIFPRDKARNSRYTIEYVRNLLFTLHMKKRPPFFEISQLPV
jgi:hypothetical protein